MTKRMQELDPETRKGIDAILMKDGVLFNPDDWNEWPKSQPPYYVMMKLKVGNRGLHGTGFLANYEGEDLWHFRDGRQMPKWIYKFKILYRPLEVDDERNH